MADVLWYYARDSEQFGPVSSAELKQLVEEGRLSPDDLLWREGMDAWTTANSLKGLFDEPPAAEQPAVPQPQATIQPPAASNDVLSRRPMAVLAGATAQRPPAQRAGGPSLNAVLRATQTALWAVCVLVVLAGTGLFTRDFLRAADAAERTAAGVVYLTFIVAAYVLARCGQHVSRLLLEHARRRTRG